MSSFANTSGGLLILGVKTDGHNRPESIVGLPNRRGFTEQVAEICRDNIHPPILPAMTQLLPFDEDPTKAVGVLRIAKSAESAHAIRNKDLVYVRRGDVSDCISIIDVDRVAYLLERRKNLSAILEASIALNIERLKRFIRPDPYPIAWWHIGPLYPWQNIVRLKIAIMRSSERS